MIETERLILRRWRAADREAFAALNASAEVCKFLPKRLTREESDAFADRIDDHFETRGFGLFAVERKDSGAFIGFTGLAVPRFDAPFMSAVEIGWRLDHAHWGKGFATEAARVALAHAFGPLGLEEVVSFTVPMNTRSRAVMEKIGLQHDPADDFDHPMLEPGDPLRRHVLYRIGRERAA
ncbi:GNAT family N-acetyltransferase [Nisaea nitritireducens]|uniref:GNAT family N-acetyltransferase n=1 Tax=Nisaea nitritireducens TaxID=568392 RepID=UPI0018663405|nr:GNAT family N-acetyltransferase [Nisaea nitritireducens]